MFTINFVDKHNLLFVFFSGCIKEDYDCDYSQKLIVSVYSKSLCETDTVYPAEVKDLTLCVFDENDILVAYAHKGDVTLGKDIVRK